MREIAVPRVSTNDDACTLREWKVADVSRVEADTVIALVEDSKTVVEVIAGEAGFLRRLGEVGKEYAVGAVIGYLLADEASAKDFVPTRSSAGAPAAVSSGGDQLLTKGARELMAERGVKDEDVKALGKDVIRRSDIEALLQSKARPEEAGIELPRQQRTVGRVVSESHRTIPKAFLLVKMTCESLLERLEGRPISLTDVLIKILGDLAGRFPNCFARLEGSHLVLPEAGINVGVTFDLGSGLFIPVVRDADSKALGEISSDLSGFRDKALDGQFKEQDLVGGHISLSLNVGEGVVLSLPIIVPGQASIVSLGGVLQEVAPAPEGGGFVVRRYVHIGLAYDHRILNGSYAMDFLEALRRRIEYPGSNRWL